MLMTNRLQTKVYTFSVEGETEKWYLERVEELINDCNQLRFKVSLKVEVIKNPIKFVKKIIPVQVDYLCHVCDVEGQTPGDISGFENTLRDMKKASESKKLEYHLGYSNYSFELWMIFHKQDCFGSLGGKRDYLSNINRAFGTGYQDLNEYKAENNFQHCLQQITLDDVRAAIRRAEHVINQKRTTGEQEIAFAKHRYYRSNPALSIHLVIKHILTECLVP